MSAGNLEYRSQAYLVMTARVTQPDHERWRVVHSLGLVASISAPSRLPDVAIHAVQLDRQLRPRQLLALGHEYRSAVAQKDVRSNVLVRYAVPFLL